MDKKEIEKIVEEELGDIISEYAEKITQNMITERMENVRASTLELGIDIKILPRPSGEYGVANKNDELGLFPSDEYEIIVWGEFDKEPVVHVVGYGWDVAVYYETGEVYGVVSAGSNAAVFDYIRTYMPTWLKLKSTLYSKATNRDVIHSGWSCFN